MTVFVSLLNWAMQHFNPTNFEKQEVILVLNIFNEKAAAFWDLKGYNVTAIFVKAITTLWNCLTLNIRCLV